MMTEMMNQCCGEDGKPALENMKRFMEHCGKAQFSEDDIAMMKQFCAQEDKPDSEKMKQVMENCGCHVG